MAKFTGSALYVSFNSVVITGSQRAFDPEEDMGTVDGSAGADAARSYVNTLKDGKASLDWLLANTTTGDATWAALTPGTAATLIWGELGNTVGNIKHTVNATVTSRKKSHPYDGLTTGHVEFVFNAAVADTTF